MLAIVAYSRHSQSGHITRYFNRTFDGLPTPLSPAFRLRLQAGLDYAVPASHFAAFVPPPYYEH